jgi:hypothetical protein
MNHCDMLEFSLAKVILVLGIFIIRFSRKISMSITIEKKKKEK